MRERNVTTELKNLVMVCAVDIQCVHIVNKVKEYYRYLLYKSSTSTRVILEKSVFFLLIEKRKVELLLDPQITGGTYPRTKVTFKV